MAGRLAKILEQEYKTKGLVGGLASAGGKRLKEMLKREVESRIDSYSSKSSKLSSLLGCLACYPVG